MFDQSIFLLRDKTLAYDILYKMDEAECMMYAEPMLSYDEDIDLRAISDLEKIIEPLCCKKGYYLKGYYETMMKKRRKISRQCIVCDKEMDKLSYEKLCGSGKKFSFCLFVATVLTVVTAVVSTFFINDQSSFN